MRAKFKKTQYGVVEEKFYNIDVIRKEKMRWLRQEMCCTCRRKTKFMLLVNLINLDSLWRTKYIWCCGPDCMEKEIELVKLEVLEKITH
jgi:hypothetical protein